MDMNGMSRLWCVPAVLLTLLPSQSLAATEIPYWARQYGVTCGQCHVNVPRLNDFGAAFIARGYRMPPDSAFAQRRTLPLAFWVSGRSDSRPPGATRGDLVRAYLNRVELISGGPIVAPWLSYFVEWRTVSQEPRADGTLRDRSGRFEDLFVTAGSDNLTLTVGQLRQIDQVDVSRRLGLSEPLPLSASLSGSPGGTSRQQSLRAFAPAGRAPLARLSVQRPLRLGVRRWTWTTSASVSVPGEFSIPVTEAAQAEASNEIEWRSRGAFVESFVRAGPLTAGMHAFYDDGRRYLMNAVTTGRATSFYWTGVAGVARTGDLLAGRWSLEGEYIPSQFGALGARVEDRAADGAGAAFLPYLNFGFPATRGTVRLTVERRIQRGRGGTFLELGTVF